VPSFAIDFDAGVMLVSRAAVVQNQNASSVCARCRERRRPDGTRAWNAGVVFKLDKTGETVPYSFTGWADGANPVAGLIRDPTGNFYGTTEYGGASGWGVCSNSIRSVKTVLHSFVREPADGANPAAGLIRDSAGNLYGTTE
jgi:hypothetical protein